MQQLDENLSHWIDQNISMAASNNSTSIQLDSTPALMQEGKGQALNVPPTASSQARCFPYLCDLQYCQELIHLPSSRISSKLLL